MDTSASASSCCRLIEGMAERPDVAWAGPHADDVPLLVQPSLCQLAVNGCMYNNRLRSSAIVGTCIAFWGQQAYTRCLLLECHKPI